MNFGIDKQKKEENLGLLGRSWVGRGVAVTLAEQLPLLGADKVKLLERFEGRQAIAPSGLVVLEHPVTYGYFAGLSVVSPAARQTQQYSLQKILPFHTSMD